MTSTQTAQLSALVLKLQQQTNTTQFGSGNQVMANLEQLNQTQNQIIAILIGLVRSTPGGADPSAQGILAALEGAIHAATGRRQHLPIR